MNTTPMLWAIIVALYVAGVPMAIFMTIPTAPDREPVLWRAILTVMFWPFVVLCIWPMWTALEFTRRR